MRVVIAAWGCVIWRLMGYRSRRGRGIVRYSTESGGEKERYGDCFFLVGVGTRPSWKGYLDHVIYEIIRSRVTLSSMRDGLAGLESCLDTQRWISYWILSLPFPLKHEDT